MTILNFTVGFAEAKILDGTKQRSMRPVRDNPNSVWNRLYVKFQKEKKHNQRSMNDYTPYPKDAEDTQLYPRIQLQLWWQQRSRFMLCPKCGCKYSKDVIGDSKECLSTECNPLGKLPPKLIKEAHVISNAVLTNMTKRTLGSLSEDEFKLDGFEPQEIVSYDQGGNADVSTMNAKDVGLLWFSETYDIPLNEGTADYMMPVLNMEVFIIEFRRVT